VALAALALLGYLVSRWRRPTDNDLALRSRRELKRAQAVAQELEKIAWTVRQSLSRHHASVLKFKERVGRLSECQQDTTWKDLCREAEEILKPTLQLAAQLVGAYDEIRQQSAALMSFTEIRSDPLTGVLNRRGLDDTLQTQIALLDRYHTPFAVVMFDIDHFKEVNDREGHLHGDVILQELAHLFDECVRETDVVARYGGEEFVVVMPQTELAGACVLSDRLRCRIAERMRITVSGGVAAARDGDSPESLLARADTALYGAKSAGRNRVYRHLGDVVLPVADAEVHDDAIALSAIAES